jgi:hypothetical protein
MPIVHETPSERTVIWEISDAFAFITLDKRV